MYSPADIIFHLLQYVYEELSDKELMANFINNSKQLEQLEEKPSENNNL